MGRATSLSSLVPPNPALCGVGRRECFARAGLAPATHPRGCRGPRLRQVPAAPSGSVTCCLRVPSPHTHHDSAGSAALGARGPEGAGPASSPSPLFYPSRRTRYREGAPGLFLPSRSRSRGQGLGITPGTGRDARGTRSGGGTHTPRGSGGGGERL